MNGGTDLNTALMMTEDEQVTEEKGKQEKGSPSGKQTAVIMTDEEGVRVATPNKEIGKEESGLSELGSSPLGSFQSLQSSQSSEGDKMITYVPPLGEVKVL